MPTTIEENPTPPGPDFLGTLIGLLVSPIQGLVAVTSALFLGLMASRVLAALGVHEGNDPLSTFLGICGASLLAGALSFTLARFFPILAKGARFTWLYGAYLLYKVYGLFPSAADVRESFSTHIGHGEEIQPYFGPFLGFCLCSYSLFALLGTLARKRAERMEADLIARLTYSASPESPDPHSSTSL